MKFLSIYVSFDLFEHLYIVSFIIKLISTTNFTFTLCDEIGIKTVLIKHDAKILKIQLID